MIVFLKYQQAPGHILCVHFNSESIWMKWNFNKTMIRIISDTNQSLNITKCSELQEMLLCPFPDGNLMQFDGLEYGACDDHKSILMKSHVKRIPFFFPFHFVQSTLNYCYTRVAMCVGDLVQPYTYTICVIRSTIYVFRQNDIGIQFELFFCFLSVKSISASKFEMHRVQVGTLI